jgi:hypothetical protein
MKNKNSHDFDLVNLAQFINNVYDRRKKIVLVLFVATFSFGIYDSVTIAETSQSFYLIKCNETFFQNKNNDVKQIGLELSYNLTNYVTNKNYEGLSKLINIDQKNVESIYNIKVVNISKNDHFFRIYLYFKNQISSYEIMSKMVSYMNNQPLLIEQKKLNELYFNQNVEELNLKINDYDHDSLKSKNEINDILILIKQKNELLVKSKLNKPFYITNPENKIISNNNYMLIILKYVFSFLFISFTIILILEGRAFIKKYSS